MIVSKRLLLARHYNMIFIMWQWFIHVLIVSFLLSSFHLQESGKNTGIKIKCPIHHKTFLDHFPFANKMFASFSYILFGAKDNMLSTFTISLFCQNKLFRQKEDSSETSKVHLSPEKETMFTIPSSHTSLVSQCVIQKLLFDVCLKTNF